MKGKEKEKKSLKKSSSQYNKTQIFELHVTLDKTELPWNNRNLFFLFYLQRFYSDVKNKWITF